MTSFMEAVAFVSDVFLYVGGKDFYMYDQK